VQRALRIGFTLAELRSRRRVYHLAQEKLKGIAADIEALKRTERYLKKVLAEWNQRIESAGPGQQSHLLYSLSEAVKNAGLTRKPVSEEKQTLKILITILLFGGLQLSSWCVCM
jgi:hypothetical protein